MKLLTAPKLKGKGVVVFLWISFFLVSTSSLFAQRKPETLVLSGGHSDEITALLSSPHRPEFISCGKDAAIRIWDKKTGNLLQTLLRCKNKSGEGEILAAALSPQGNLLAIGGKDLLRNGIELIEVTSGRSIQVLKSVPQYWKSEKITALAFSPDGRHLLAGTEKGWVFGWGIKSTEDTYDNLNAESFEKKSPLVHTLQRVKKTGIDKIAFSKNSDEYVVAGHDGSLWSTQFSQNSSSTFLSKLFPKLEQQRKVPAKFSSLHFLNDSIIHYSSEKGIVQTANMRTPQKIERTIAYAHRAIYALAFSPNQNLHFIGGNFPCHAQIVHTQSGENQTYLEIGLHIRSITAAVFLGNDTLVTGDQEGKIMMWDAHKGSLIHNCAGKGEVIRSLGMASGPWIGAGYALNSQMIDLCGENQKLQPIPIHHLNWAFSPVEMKVRRLETEGEEFTGPILTHSNGDRLKVNDRSKYVWKRKDKEKGKPKDLKYVHFFRINQMGEVELDQPWDTFWMPPSILGKRKLFLPQKNQFSIVHWPIRYRKPRTRTFSHPAVIGMLHPATNWIMVAGQDGVLRIFSKNKLRKPICSLYVEGPESWICWTPDLHFVGQGAALDKAGYLVKDKATKDWKFTPVPADPRSESAPQIIQKRLLKK